MDHGWRQSSERRALEAAQPQWIGAFLVSPLPKFECHHHNNVALPVEAENDSPTLNVDRFRYRFRMV